MLIGGFTGFQPLYTSTPNHRCQGDDRPSNTGLRPTAVIAMTDWNYRIDGYGGIVTVKRSIDNTVESVCVDMDCYAEKTLTDREFQKLSESEQDEYDWVDDEEPQWAKYGKGAYAKLRFSVDSDGVAEFDGVNDDNWDEDGYNFPTWLRLVDPAERLVAEVDGVEEVKDTTDQFHTELEVGETATITN